MQGTAGQLPVLTRALPPFPSSQRVARVLWNQLNKETREHHITCVELFYRLHCLAPTANICEDIICHALLDPDKVSAASL